MCGILGVVGNQEATPFLLDGLRRMEYRGYDSAGIATLSDGALHCRRASGKLVNLTAVIDKNPIHGTVGIGHTRWATHGAPTERNAHPHATKKVAIVHNGIIENYGILKKELSALGHVFESDTDSEVVTHLLTQALDEGKTPKQALLDVLPKLKGAFALGIIFTQEPDSLMVARQGCPLAIGYGEGEMFIGSDALALAPVTEKISYLEEGDWACVTRDDATIYNLEGDIVTRPIKRTNVTGAMIGKGDHRHFMEKEIFEQPVVLGDALQSILSQGHLGLSLSIPLETIKRLYIVACGTSYYAAMTAKYWFERWAKIPVEVDIASEFRYRQPPLDSGTLPIFISQSGETADTLAALEYVKKHLPHVVALVNTEESSIARRAETVLPLRVGPEIGVASTKAFTAQLLMLSVLALTLARARGTLSDKDLASYEQALLSLPETMNHFLATEPKIIEVAQWLMHHHNALYLGRGHCYPIALEGALKLKELSYIHAEAYASGEMKHGPIALIDESLPVVVVAPGDSLFEKTVSNVEEVAARGGQIILFTDEEGAHALAGKVQDIVIMPTVSEFTAPIAYAIPMQLLAYHVARLKGTDVDQPRNLAKSVTVE